MPFVTYPQQILGLKIRKRLGLPNQCGWAICGWSQCGDVNQFSGVYQQRRKRIGNNHTWRIGDPKPHNFMQKPAWPSNVYHENRQIWRNQFKVAVEAWQALTSEQKEGYNKIAIKKGRHGYNFFIAKTLKSL
jgi:hypothetical protein